MALISLAAAQVVIHNVVQTNDVTPTILGAVGISLALASLGWQAYTFLRSGSRVRVRISAGVTDGSRVVTSTGAQLTDRKLSYGVGRGSYDWMPAPRPYA